MRARNRREHFRIPYLPSDGPRLVIGTTISEVLDCSEAGVRFRAAAPLHLPAGAEFEGRLRLRCGADVRVRGVILRRSGETASARLLDRGVPFGAILHEQLHLRAAARAAAT